MTLTPEPAQHTTIELPPCPPKVRYRSAATATLFDPAIMRGAAVDASRSCTRL